MRRVLKKLSIVFFVILLVGGFGIAQQEVEKKEVEIKKVVSCCMEMMPQMMPQMMQRMPMMMGRAEFKVTKDAIFVLKGNYLLKYDLDLNLIKKVELPTMEMPMMMQMMQHMEGKQSCPHMKETKKEEKP